MSNLTPEQAMALSTLIYHESLEGNAPPRGETITVGELATNLGRSDHSGAHMSNAEWNQALDFVSNDPVLSRLTISGDRFSDDARNGTNTGFRAMVVTDPRGQHNTTVVFRGTPDHAYQWHDNLFKAHDPAWTPSQIEARRFVTDLGMENLFLVGHSKGGNFAEQLAFALPSGMVNGALNFNGPRLSQAFLSSLTPEQIRSGHYRTMAIREIRDIVARINAGNMGQGNEWFFISDQILMNLFMYHKPNLFMGRPLFPTSDTSLAMLDALMEWDDIGTMSTFMAMLIWGESDNPDDPSGFWNLALHMAMVDANNVFMASVARRIHQKNALFDALLERLGYSGLALALKKYNADNSKVVDGAIISCDFCDVLGELRSSGSHGSEIHGLPVLAETDTMEGENIIFEGGICAIRTMALLESLGHGSDAFSVTGNQHLPAGVAPVPCEPDTSGNKWLITADNQTIGVGGASENAVLRKSVLVCDHGGLIQIILSGQFGGSINVGALEAAGRGRGGNPWVPDTRNASDSSSSSRGVNVPRGAAAHQPSQSASSPIPSSAAASGLADAPTRPLPANTPPSPLPARPPRTSGPHPIDPLHSGGSNDPPTDR